MTTEQALFLLAVFSLAGIGFLATYAKSLKGEIDDLKESLNKNWRYHNDDYHEMYAKHQQLVDALGMTRANSIPSRYVKKDEA